MEQNFLACVNGNWKLSGSTPVCDGSLNVYTTKEMIALIEQEKGYLTLEQANQLLEPTLIVFAIVFGFLILKKAMS